jgi:hypothetical protein
MTPPLTGRFYGEAIYKDVLSSGDMSSFVSYLNGKF